jgi:DnaJ-class molecular chaperone
VKDYYAILGLPMAATEAEIDAAFRALARRCHPDLRPEAEGDDAIAQFKLATEAYEVLSDAERRRAYDNATRRKARWRPSVRPRSADSISAPTEAQAGCGRLDVVADVHLVPEEAAAGGPIELRLTVSHNCSECKGRSDGTCHICNGLGTIHESHTAQLHVPPGVRDDTVLCLPGFGRGADGLRGDLYLRVRVRPCW